MLKSFSNLKVCLIGEWSIDTGPADLGLKWISNHYDFIGKILKLFHIKWAIAEAYRQMVY